jgi:transposase
VALAGAVARIRGRRIEPRSIGGDTDAGTRYTQCALGSGKDGTRRRDEARDRHRHRVGLACSVGAGTRARERVDHVRDYERDASIFENRRQHIDLPEDQRQGLVKIREEITEQIEYQPSRFYLLQLVRPVYAHPKKEQGPVVAALPPQVIPQAGVGPGFIAHVLIAKCVDHLPLYRQERIDARGGVWIGRLARCRYVEAAAHLLITIRSLLIDMILRNGYVQVDETFTKLMDPDRRGRSHDAYFASPANLCRKCRCHVVKKRSLNSLEFFAANSCC